LCFWGGTTLAQAAGPAPAPAAPSVSGNTLWHWLGIPQGYNKVRDARVNRSGDNPGRERLPPLKRIADPENIYSQNPAIQTAAKIKAEEDLAPQKIKAIKYLGTVGCSCYPGVREALLAALEDCTEAVRYEAAIALCQVAGNPCKHCDKSGCCNAEVMNKLNDMAYGQDAKGCCKEPSERVRQAAANALNACKRKNPTTPMIPVPETVPEGSERKPIPAPNEDIPEGKSTERGVPTPAPMPPESVRFSTTASMHPTGYSSVEGIALAGDASPGQAIATAEPNGEAIAEQVSFLRFGKCRHRYVPCPQEQICPEQSHAIAPSETPLPEESAKMGETPAMPGETGPNNIAPEESYLPPSNALASDYGATSGPLSSAPKMIGDFFGSGGVSIRTYSESLSVAPLPGNALPRFKMAENTSPLPQDRIYFDFNSFTNVPLTETPSSVRSFTPGFEKTFFDGVMSFEMRLPMASTLSNDVFADGSTTTASGEFGDMGIALKTLILRREKFLLSGGLAMSLPTAENTQLISSRSLNATTMLEFQNQSVHLMPFFGGLWTPNDRWFAIGYVQIDVDANGDPVIAYPNFRNEFLGRYHDTTYLYADLGLGYWARRSENRNQFFTGLAYSLEFHLNQSLQGQQVLDAGEFQIGTHAENVSCTDLTVGTHLELYKMTTVTAALIVPLTADRDRQFDSQFRLFVNRRF
jgi:hypothetical protein